MLFTFPNLSLVGVQLQNMKTFRPIRKLDTRKDLNPVADLIETCFAEHLDPDGHTYLSVIRRAARNQLNIRWITVAGEKISYPLHGFVWEEEGQVIGNLSLIPILYQKKYIYLIANVAVEPGQRRKGIARKLTQKALEHLKRLGFHEAWLHVREDNLPAIHLYEAEGFQEITRRTHWLSSPTQTTFISNLDFCPRKYPEWPQQLEWLKETYPPEVRWHLAFNISKFHPGFPYNLMRFFMSQNLKSWSVHKNGNLIGTATWEQNMNSHADNLWLGVPPEHENECIPFLLSNVCKQPSRRPLLVNYPADRADSALQQGGFIKKQTLSWMKAEF